MILYYVHDPMCSWCWGFRPTWSEIKTRLPDQLEVKYLLGGLAPDSDEPMSEQMQQDIAGYWRRIQQQISGTEFNFDFWQKCQPRRSTYPACRAVIATRKQNPELELEMIKRIQTAYYLEAQNPSNDETLIALAVSLGLDSDQFATDLNTDTTQQQLNDEMAMGQKLGAQGFPSLILVKGGQAQYVPLDYNSADATINLIESLI